MIFIVIYQYILNSLTKNNLLALYITQSIKQQKINIYRINLFLNSYSMSIQLPPQSTAKTTQNLSNSPQKKIVFLEPHDQSSLQMHNIMSTIYKKQQQIMDILNRYKDTIPNDTSVYGQQIKDSRAKLIANRQHKYQPQRIKNKSQKKQINKSIYKKKTGNNNSNNASDFKNSYDIYKENSKTIAHTSRSMDKVENGLRLPLLNKKQMKKDQIQVKYQKADKQYNENVAKFYEAFRNKNTTKVMDSQNKNGRIKGKRKRGNQQKKNVQLYQLGLQDTNNIFDTNQSPQLYDPLLNQQITQPIPYHPYSQTTTQHPNPNLLSNSKASRIVSLSLTQDDDQKPTQVPMSYYIRTLNEKIKQQSKQQINYLYFSKSQSDQKGTNKQWTQQIIKMFQKHDEELIKMHHSMKYLDSFDQGFFTAGIYQAGQSKKI